MNLNIQKGNREKMTRGLIYMCKFIKQVKTISTQKFVFVVKTYFTEFVACTIIKKVKKERKIATVI